MAQTQSTLLNSVEIDYDQVKCRYCGKFFSPQGLGSHISTCPVRKSNYDIY